MMMIVVVLITNDNNGDVMIASIGGDIDDEYSQKNSITNANLKDVILASIYLQIHFHSGSLFSNIKNTVCSNPGILFAANQARQLAWSNTLIEDLSELAYRTLFYQDQARQGNPTSHYQMSYLVLGL